MKIAVIKTGGKQYVVKEKDKLKIEKIAVEVGQNAQFDTLLVADGDKVEIGSPVLKTQTEVQVVRHGRSRKVIGIKYKPKTRQARKFGHRRNFTEIEISKI